MTKVKILRSRRKKAERRRRELLKESNTKAIRIEIQAGSIGGIRLKSITNRVRGDTRALSLSLTSDLRSKEDNNVQQNPRSGNSDNRIKQEAAQEKH
ncbi:hypothetical protein C922_05657 [Plasmodium inui San Antonio 1]|uniref:Uncharacterized protein n=1 Tax=Plasmodium inui San Antonio 1 TaxID=1237626 RepID=W6ZSR7_9APIC|nr:hypothetical protein C922_05657 [Plasmodium inui San Antonio 1]EUD63962.1 hypothetical protein C922_05657 [Plasmodium inui San Antonio 1]